MAVMLYHMSSCLKDDDDVFQWYAIIIVPF